MPFRVFFFEIKRAYIRSYTTTSLRVKRRVMFMRTTSILPVFVISEENASSRSFADNGSFEKMTLYKSRGRYHYQYTTSGTARERIFVLVPRLSALVRQLSASYERAM